MKKLAPALAALSALLLAPPPAAADLSVRFSLGAGFVRTGDLEAGIKGYNDLSAGLYGSALRGGFSAPGLGYEPSAEIVLSLGKGLGIGLGAGYASHSRSSEMSYDVAAAAVTERLTAGISGIPLQLNLRLDVPLSDRVAIGAWAGPAVHFLRLSWDYEMRIELEGQTGTDHFVFKSDKRVIGGQAGIGVAFKLSGSIDLLAEISGRFAETRGFSGSWTEKGSGDFWAITDAGEASAWAFDLRYSGKKYRQLSFQESKPAGANVDAADQASIGLTGVGARIGVRVRLPFFRRAARG